MRCLHCGKRLSLLRKFSDGEFCTAEHRQIFQQQQSDLALARLIESQNRIERPAMPKPAPKPVARPKAAAGEAEQAVPEARPIAEWFKPNGRKVLFVPRTLPFDPKLSSSAPGSNVALQQKGFVAPEGLRLGLELSPLARNGRQAVLNPLFRLGIRLPAGAKPVQPGLEPQAAGLKPLPIETGLSGAVTVCEAPAGHLDSAGAACIPVLLFGTVAPDRQDALAPEPMGLAEALFPLACPIAGPVPARIVSEVELYAAHPMPRQAVMPAIALDRPAEVEAEPLPLSEILFAVALPGVERGLACAVAVPQLDLPRAFGDWGPEEAPGVPVYPLHRVNAALREETGMAAIGLPGAPSVPILTVELELAALVAPQDPALPSWSAAPPEPVMASCKRTARMKVRAVGAAAGTGFEQIAVEALPSERTPGQPHGLTLQGGTDLVHDETLRAIDFCGVLNVARPMPSGSPEVEIEDAAPAPYLPIGMLRPEIPEPVVTVPEVEESFAQQAAEEVDEPVFVRVVRPLIDDSAPDALSGWPEEEFAAELAAQLAMAELAETPAAEPAAAELPVSEELALPQAVEPQVESVPVAALEAQPEETAQETSLPAEAEASVLAMASEAVVETPEVSVAADLVAAVVETEAPEAEAAILPIPVEALVAATEAAMETAEAETAPAPSSEITEQESLPDEAVAYAALAQVEPELAEAQETLAALRAEEPGAAVQELAESVVPEAEQPAPVAEPAGPPECDQLRIFAGRGETGPATKPHYNKGDDHGIWPESLAAEPLRPKSRLMIDQADGSGPRRANAERSAKSPGGLLRFDTRKLPGRRFWAHAPSDLKWVALGLPLILALIVYSFKASPPKSETGRPVADSRSHSVIGSELNSIQKVILDRAAIKLYDDFRGGLGSWHGTEGWAKTWKYGEASFLEPGQLALYSPTVNMRDYTMQFLGQIERRSLNWVFRATDSKNYYAMRIVITKAGPLPQASVVRYAVINGKEVGMKTLPLPFPVHSDTLYLVKMEVRGDSFTTYIQSQVVDNFTDSRLEGGGIGFFSPKGDKSYLRWVEVTHQYDVLGRLCALLAPYNVQAEGRKTE